MGRLVVTGERVVLGRNARREHDHGAVGSIVAPAPGSSRLVLQTERQGMGRRSRYTDADPGHTDLACRAFEARR